ncbi:uncharacterized protein LOC106766145 [Vigna radiata var. radiata]|uniref:Uncharacterized protein LOC106766145 n=1 Tax=Vigna radiata var. radiata TaxID=3916 RepID=A0A1S3UK37_VIGRR|nr:uncharacterized protein LOC106766145 [Vigna radiata var. radiata]
MVTTRSMDNPNQMEMIRELQAQLEEQAHTIRQQQRLQQAQAKRMEEQAQIIRQQQEIQQKQSDEIARLRARRATPEMSETQGSQNNGHGRHTPPLNDRSPNPLPFTEAVMQAQMPDRPPPSIERFDGTSDPEHHLRNFIDSMAYYSNSNPVKCRAFSQSLKGEALEWYYTLPPNSVDSFRTVISLLKKQYAINRRDEITPVDLVNIKQGKDETLRAFIQRYNEVARRAKGVTHDFIIGNLPNCIKPGYVSEHLYARQPKTMEEFQERFTEYIKMEDQRSSRRKQTYHGNRGHTIEGCQGLKDELERLIHVGYLREFVREEANRARRSPKKEPVRRSLEKNTRPTDRSRSRSRGIAHDRPARGHIDTISRGFARGGASSSARKRHLRNLQSVHNVSHHSLTMPDIAFTNADFHAPDLDQDDPMVITARIAQYDVSKVLIDQGSSVNILYWSTFQKMEFSEDVVAPFNEQIVGFAGERVDTRGYLDLCTRLGTGECSKELRVRFLLVEANTTYNALLGRPCLNAFGAIVSTPHLAMKFPSEEGNICTVKVDQKTARQCYVARLKMIPFVPPNKAKQPETILVDLDPRTNTNDRFEPQGDVKAFVLGRSEDQTTSIGAGLQPEDERDLTELLRANFKLFAWSVADMPGIHPSVMTHKLSVFKEARPVAQKKRRFGDEKRDTIQEEVNKLTKAKFIREIPYTT